MRRFPGNKLELGIVDGKGVPLEMTPRMRSTHLYICGSTGTGKSKMLEHLVQQDIKQWHKSKCGALIIDPHGSLYNSLINWIAWNETYLKDVPIVPIDLRQNDWTIAYNVMRPRTVADPSVLISLQYRVAKRILCNSGMTVRLNTAVIFACMEHLHPNVLLMDEVLSVGGDMDFKKSVAKIESLLATGATIIMVSHDLNLVEKFCDRVL